MNIKKDRKFFFHNLVFNPIFLLQNIPSLAYKIGNYIYNKITENYNIGIVTTIIKKKYFYKLNQKFNKKYNHIGDLDLFIRLSKLCKFFAIQEP
jgi:hypothetical protein